MQDIIIPNEQDFEAKKQRIVASGSGNLHVVSDFDRTLTKAFVAGKKIPSLVSILRNENYLTPDYPAKAHTLFDKYHPIEIDSKISLEEKKKAMRQWWTRHFQLLIDSGLNKRDIEKAIRSKNFQLRDGLKGLLKLLSQEGIPLLIFSSSGLGQESILACLKQGNILFDNTHIISNGFKWDENGNAIGIREPIIHVLNKSEASIENYPEFETIQDRRNVVLLGDGLGDVDMVKGFDVENLIKIGFLNYEPEQNLDRFKKHFDVILLKDQSMSFVIDLIKQISEGKNELKN